MSLAVRCVNVLGGLMIVMGVATWWRVPMPVPLRALAMSYDGDHSGAAPRVLA